MKRMFPGIIMALLLMVMLILAFNTKIPLETVEATPEAVLRMNPSYATIGQEGEPIPTTQPVTISIEVESVSNLSTWQVVIYYDNNTLYTQSDWMWLPPDHVFAGKGYLEMPGVTGADSYGHYIMKSLSLYGGETPFNGNGTLCKVNFTAVGIPGTSHLNFTQPIGSIPGKYETYMWDLDWNNIPATAVEGTVEVKGTTVTKEPSNITISVDKSTVYLGDNVTISGNVTLEDGTPKPNVDVTIYNRIIGEPDFSLLKTVKTDSEGRYNYTWTPTQYDIPIPRSSVVYELQAKWIGDETTSGNQSEIINIIVERVTFYIRSDGSVDPSIGSIQRNGDLYTLTRNICSSIDAIVIERDNMTLDGAGYTVQGCQGTGINLTGRNNVTLRNMEIQDFSYGVLLDKSSNNIIVGNKITNNTTYGVWLIDSSNNIIYGNNITGNYYSIALHYSTNNNIVGNNITASKSGAAIFLYLSSSNNISENNIKDNCYGTVGDESSSNNIITGHEITANGVGINVFSSSNNITGNNIEDNGYGIGLCPIGIHGLNNNLIAENNITNNEYGIYLTQYCDYNTISENNITGNYHGIELCYSKNNNIIENNIKDNDCGIRLFLYASDNSIIGNRIRANNVGISLWKSSYNVIYHNSFKDNTCHIYDVAQDYFWTSPSINVWDDGYPSGGNYWSNYTGVDIKSGPYQNLTGSDGIGDTPHIIDKNNQDRYPLMASINILDVGTWNGLPYNIELITNSNVSNFQLDIAHKMISFNVTGVNGTAGFCRITIPNVIVNDLWLGNYTILLNGEPWPFSNWTDATNTYIYINYTYSEHQIILIPEFPSIIALSLFMSFSIIFVVLTKRKIPKI